MNLIDQIQEWVKGLIQGSRQNLSVALVGLLLIVAGFWAYSNFSKTEIGEGEEVKIEGAKEEQGSISGGATGPQISLGDDSESGLIAGATTAKLENNQTAGPWVAKDIQRNTIKASSYTVQKGDTLWEIAEGKYGSGFEWKKILETNKDKIGFLANGSQAKIEIGTVLSLP